MPHQCVRCSKLYADGSKEILTGCVCGGRFFFFIKKQSVEEMQKIASTLKDKDKEQMEHDAFELIGDTKQDAPVVLDLESIRMLKPGKFEIDLIDIFKGNPLVYKLSDGKYVIDIASTLKESLE